jgi:hypothetical protein
MNIKKAFPHGGFDSGMDLRDWFAGQALASIKDKDFASVEGVADRAYEIADAMMKQREQT